MDEPGDDLKLRLRQCNSTGEKKVREHGIDLVPGDVIPECKQTRVLPSHWMGPL